MRFLPAIILGIIGLSLGAVVASGAVALTVGLGIITRYAGITRTSRNLRWYECCCMLGVFLGNLVCLLDVSVPCGPVGPGVFGLFAGIFLGSWIIALGEVVDVYSIAARRLSLSHGLPLIILAMAAGKTAGNLLYFFLNLGAGR